MKTWIKGTQVTDETAISYVKFIIGKMYGKSVFKREQDLEDLIGYGLIGYVKAKNKYKDDRGASFNTYSETRIMGEIRDYFRSLSGRKSKKEKQKEKDTSTNIHKKVVLEFGLENAEDHFGVEDDHYFSGVFVEQFRRELSEKDNKVLDLLLEGKNNTEIAHELGVWPVTVGYMRNRIEDILSKHISRKQFSVKERDELIRAEFATGDYKRKQLAAKWGMTLGGLYNILNGIARSDRVVKKPKKVKYGKEYNNPNGQAVTYKKASLLRAKIVDLRKEGKHPEEIATEVGRSLYRVNQILRKEGLGSRASTKGVKPVNTKSIQTRREIVREQYVDKNKRPVEIAEDFKINYYTVIRIIKELGIKKPSKAKIEREKIKKPRGRAPAPEGRNDSIYEAYKRGDSIQVMCETFNMQGPSLMVLLSKLKKLKGDTSSRKRGRKKKEAQRPLSDNLIDSQLA